jgi:hypothetical protein
MHTTLTDGPNPTGPPGRFYAEPCTRTARSLHQGRTAPPSCFLQACRFLNAPTISVERVSMEPHAALDILHLPLLLCLASSCWTQGMCYPQHGRRSRICSVSEQAFLCSSSPLNCSVTMFSAWIAPAWTAHRSWCAVRCVGDFETILCLACLVKSLISWQPQPDTFSFWNVLCQGGKAGFRGRTSARRLQRLVSCRH